MKTLFIADPIERLKPTTDSSFVFIRRCITRKHQAFWCSDKDVEFSGDKVLVHAMPVTESRVDETPHLGPRERIPIHKFQLVFIRKDPPFDTSYVRLCWILSLAEKRTTFLNLPSLLVRYHEKLIPIEAMAQGFLGSKDIISTHLGSSETAVEFVRSLSTEEVVTKPFLGYGGTGVERVSAVSYMGKHLDAVVQPFKKEVLQGDHRVFFLEGKNIGSFARIPKAGGFISNLAAGGSAQAVKLKPSQLKVLDKLGKFLKKSKIFFAGADLIGNCISEVNITSPTGLRSFESLFGTDLSELIVSSAEKLSRR